MKTHLHAALAILLFVASSILRAQTTDDDALGRRVAIDIPENTATNPCVTPAEYEAIEQRTTANCSAIGLTRAPQSGAARPSLAWPLRPAHGLDDCSFYRISAHVDEDPATGAFKDYNCGTITYDGHRGTDISIFPFPFYKMDNDQVEVIAAAPGTIVDKSDGNFDKNCSSNSMTANYIVIQHDDGSRILYFHMKKNSLTSKIVGNSVAVGEYLGVVGSSGNSSGPHLHFEVWSGSTVATLNDPFAGTCNLLNDSTWWASQLSYKETAITKASVHTTDVTLPPCPTTETVNESTTYEIPFQGPGLSPGYAKFYISLRNETSGLSADCAILNPDGSTFNSWTYNSTSNHGYTVWGFSKKLPTLAGKYTFQATYNGTTCARQFDVTTPPAGVGSSLTPADLEIYPNPTRGAMHISGGGLTNGKCKLVLRNMLGEMVEEEESVAEGNAIHPNFSTTSLPRGVYVLTIESRNVFRMVKISVLD